MLEIVEFATLMLEWVHTNCITSSREFNNLTAVLDAYTYVKLLSVLPKIQGVMLLPNFVEKFSVSAAEKISKKVTGLPSAEVKFQQEIIVSKTHFIGSQLIFTNHPE